jgi:aspartate racemase
MPVKSSVAPKPNSYTRRIGAISIDPRAGQSFGAQLVKQAGNVTDQEHVETVLYQATQIPSPEDGSRSATLRGIRQGLDLMHRVGMNIAVVTDTASHADIKSLRAHIEKYNPSLELIDVPHTAVDALQERAPGARNVGLIVSPETFGRGVYQQHVKDKNWSASGGDHAPMTAAERPNANERQIEQGHKTLLASVREMAQNGNVDAIVVGYPGLADSLPQSVHVNGRDIPVINSNAAAASKAMQLARQDRAEVSEVHSNTCGCLPISVRGVVDDATMAFAKLTTRPVDAHGPKAGVMGGQGALAGVQFMGETGGLEVLVHQATHIADRTAFLKKQMGTEGFEDAADPRPEMYKSLDLMARAGVTNVVVTCNTAHAFIGDLRQYVQDQGYDINILHIAGAAMDEVEHQHGPGAHVVALMATDGTVNSRLYQDYGNNPHTWVVPDEKFQKQGMRSIYEGVKQNNLEQGRDDACAVVDSLVAKFELEHPGKPVIIALACTEFPVALDKETRKRWPNVTFVDTLASLSKKLISESNVAVPASAENVERLSNELRSTVRQQEDRMAA